MVIFSAASKNDVFYISTNAETQQMINPHLLMLIQLSQVSLNSDRGTAIM